ncbi:MAG: hypothetical protein HQL36_05445 [Alphaproteobacteria bacterium]|nr:hypothetical protein [Alphaproteobacteria bacterium]MBF0249611.1 hypothetical protein [Alphaproteobacteria bacterium]
MRLVIAVVLGLAVALGAAGASAQIRIQQSLYEPKTEFSKNQFDWAMKRGTGVIAGQAVMKAQGGVLKYGAKQRVVLVPRNSYTDEIVSASREKNFFKSYDGVSKHPDYDTYRRVAVADDEGRFRFEDLPAGEWYLGSQIVWYTKSSDGRTHMNGGVLWGLITIADGEVRDDVRLDSTTEMVR